LVLTVAFGRPAAPAVCTGARSAWGETWSEATRPAALEAFRNSGRPDADALFVRVDEALDVYRGAWVAMHEDACRATRVRGEQSDAMLDLRLQCLDDRRKLAHALTRTLARAERPVVDQALAAVGKLPNIEDCANAKALAAKVPLPS